MVAEKVLFTGASQTISSGNKLVHGQQGEVKGPATFESVKGKGVCVPLLFLWSVLNLGPERHHGPRKRLIS